MVALELIAAERRRTKWKPLKGKSVRISKPFLTFISTVTCGTDPTKQNKSPIAVDDFDVMEDNTATFESAPQNTYDALFSNTILTFLIALFDVTMT